MIYEVNTFMKRHQLIKQNATVLIGVSGGPDSMALLHYYHSIRADWNLTLYALSVDHQLRGDEGANDLHYVKRICENWNIPFIGTAVDVPTYKAEYQLGTQIAARNLRYRFFEEQMIYYNADFLALAHHGDDQVETMIMSLVRSATSSTFSGMPVKRPFANGFIVRPFLCLTKARINHYCKEHNIEPRLDPTNIQTDYTRNYFRKYVIPRLKDKNNNIHITIQHLSESLSEDEKYLQQQAKKMVDQVVYMHESPKNVVFKIDAFKSFPTALQRRAFHLILNYLYDKLPKKLTYVHEEHFFALLENNNGNTEIDFPDRLKVNKSYQELVFYFQEQQPQASSFHIQLDVPGEIYLPDGAKMEARYTEDLQGQDTYSFLCAVEQIALPLHIRNRRKGDRMRWQGLNGSKKIKDIFIDAKVPLTERDTWPILTDNNGEILWLIGLKKGKWETNSNSNKFIQVNYDKGDM